MPKNKSRRNKTDNKEIVVCKDCEKPINKNNLNSDKLDGLCNKCYNLNTTENQRRKVDKKLVKLRNRERDMKNSL